MAFFRRGRNQEAAVAADELGAPEVQEEQPVIPEVGPFDSTHVSERGDRLDLGAIWLPGKQGAELRMEVDNNTQRVTGVAIALNGSILQLQAFAAPKTTGIWDEIRAEIAESIKSQGGAADDVPGTMGRELLVKLPVKLKDGTPAVQPARFVGFDGPRWFLRGVFSGRAAFDKEAAKDLEDLFRNVVVIRGTEARPPRDLLALTLPGQVPSLPNPVAPTQPDLNPLQRGPEITQIG